MLTDFAYTMDRTNHHLNIAIQKNILPPFPLRSIVLFLFGTVTWWPADSMLGEGGHGKGEAGGGGAGAPEVGVSVPEVSGRYTTNP